MAANEVYRIQDIDASGSLFLRLLDQLHTHWVCAGLFVEDESQALCFLVLATCASVETAAL